jgi:hypothetical protein
MIRALILDDIRSPLDPEFLAAREVHLFRTAEEAMETLIYRDLKSPFNEIWLDYDLGGYNTADPVVDWLCEQAFIGHPYPVNKIMLHTDNPVGRDKMKLVLERYGYHVWISDFPY